MPKTSRAANTKSDADNKKDGVAQKADTSANKNRPKKTVTLSSSFVTMPANAQGGGDADSVMTSVRNGGSEPGKVGKQQPSGSKPVAKRKSILKNAVLQQENGPTKFSPYNPNSRPPREVSTSKARAKKGDRKAGRAASARRNTCSNVMPIFQRGRRRSSSPRRLRPRTRLRKGKHVNEQLDTCVGAVRAALHWRWLACDRVHLTHDSELEPWLPAEMHAEKPAYSRWKWNARRGTLHWGSEPQNPVEDFYTASSRDKDIKKHHGLFGRRYKKYPNVTTYAHVENNKGIFSRAKSHVEDRDERASNDTSPVTIADIKEVAEAAVGQFFPTAYGRRRFSNILDMDRFLLSLIEYFHHYFQDRRVEELAKQNNCLVYDTTGRKARLQRMDECLSEAARCYAKFILGRDVPFHHTNGGAFGTISAASADKQYWEALYAYIIQVVWITFARPRMDVIVREIGRIFRTLYFDPARREASAGPYKNRDMRRNALTGMRAPKAKHTPMGPNATNHPVLKEPKSLAEAIARENYMAMCIAMGQVYGVYACPPMPPKAIYALFNNRSALVNRLLSEDPYADKVQGHFIDREHIGILGEPHNLFDANLDPIDVLREQKYFELKFLGPISEKAETTRIADVIPHLLQPTPPNPDDLDKFK